MDITWYGYTCFRITERGHTTVVTDPYLPGQNLTQRGLKADLVAVSHERAAKQVDDIRGDKYVIDAPGEYEIGELFVTGFPLTAQTAEEEPAIRNIAYLFEYPNGLNFVHLGALHEVPDQSVIEQLDEVHVLLLPIGGAVPSDDKLADLISLIEPGAVVPAHFANLSKSAFESALDGFLKAMGVTEVEWQDSLRITSAAANEQSQVVCLRQAG